MASTYIPVTRVEGRASRQAHANLPEGTFERELGKEGFFGPAAQMYHKHPPTAWTRWEGPLRPRAFDTNALKHETGSVWDAPVLLHNASVQIRSWRCTEPMRYLARNGDGDELIFVHRGAGELYCDYGRLDYAQGDYIVLPRSTMWRVAPTAPTDLLLVENTNGSYRLPDRGMVGKQAQFDPAILDVPRIDEAFLAQQDEREWQVLIRRSGAISTVTYPFNPLDAQGWQGDLAPVRLNVRDIRPLVSHRYHLPPSAHTTWVGNRFVICTFVPRPYEQSADSLKIPYFHNNDDYDEVIFYHDGDFMSRDNIEPGMITFHPCGFTHGPHPKALQRMFVQEKSETEEYAVMIDTRDALHVGPGGAACENPDYAESWKVAGEPVTRPTVPRPVAAE